MLGKIYCDTKYMSWHMIEQDMLKMEEGTKVDMCLIDLAVETM